MTLIEVLVCIGLVGALLGSMFAFFFDMLASRRRALDHAARQLAASLLIERLENDLTSCIVGDGASGPGVEGDATRIQVHSRSVAAHLAEKGLMDPQVLGDLQAAEYRFNQAGLIEARRLTPSDTTSPGSDFSALGPTGKLRIRYHDGKQWRDSFDSLKAGALPVAVEVALWLYALPGETPSAQPESTRLTFDDTKGFDQAQSAWDSDRETWSPRFPSSETLDEPLPDRIRVIPVPDAATKDPYAAQAQEKPQEPASP
jgi:type II secretory pathway component PulJ